MPDSGVREANTAELIHLIESAEDDRAVVSIDWVNQCIGADRQLDINPYRITLPPVQAAPDFQLEVEVEPTAVQAGPVVRHPKSSIERPQPPFQPEEACFTLPRAPHTGPAAKIPTAELSGNRHSTTTRDVIMIEDDDDYEFIVLDVLPPPKAKVKRAIAGQSYPSPPNTSLEEDTSYCHPAGPSVSRPMTHGDIDDSFDIEDEDEEEEEVVDGAVRSQSPKRDCQHDPKAADKAPPLITDPAERAQILQNGVSEDSRHPFDQLEQALQQWAIEGLNGYMTDFVRKTEKEVSPSTSTHSASLRC